jgi:hypothetical protein
MAVCCGSKEILMKKTAALLVFALGQIAFAQNTPAFVQGNNTGSTSEFSTLAYASNVTAGHALYAAFFDGSGSGHTLTFSDSQGNSWTTIKSASLTSDGDSIAVGCAIAGASASDTVTFIVNGTASTVIGSVYEVSNSTCTTDATPISSDTTAQTVCSSGSLTTTTANDLLFGFCGLSHNQSSLTAGSGWVDGLASGSSGLVYGLGELKIASTAGSYTATSATFPSGSGEQATIEIAFKATTSGGGGSTITGSGTANTVPLFTGTSTLGNSVITQSSGGNVGIGTTTPIASLDVQSGILRVGGNTNPTTTMQGGYFGWNALTGGMGETDLINNRGGGSGGFAFMTTPASGSPRTTVMLINGSGNVGIATTTPAFNLDVNGTIHSQLGIYFAGNSTPQTIPWTGVLCGGDYAEDMNAAGSKHAYAPGDVLVLSSENGADVEKAFEPYSTMVAGIYATKPGVVGQREKLAKSADVIPMAMVGVVPTKVTAEGGPIHKGDLLVTSSIAGYAMKGTDRSRMLGAVIGKAMGSLDSGKGMIEVLVTLQ